MKACLNVLLLSIITLSATAQSPETTIGYFDKKWKAVDKARGASFYRTVEPKDEAFIVRDYFISGKLQMFAECSEYSPNLVYHGVFKRYDENGTLREEGIYKNGERAGSYKHYYESGKLEDHREYIGKKIRYLSYFAEDGQALVANGVGMLTDTDDKGTVIYTRFRNYEIAACYSLKAPQDTVFLAIEKEAEYSGGVTRMVEFISKNIRYPDEDRRMGIEGTVFVSFVINKEGRVENVQVVRGISAGCDREAMRVISKFDPWVPGIQRGKPVNTRFVLPIKFGLTGE